MYSTCARKHHLRSLLVPYPVTTVVVPLQWHWNTFRVSLPLPELCKSSAIRNWNRSGKLLTNRFFAAAMADESVVLRRVIPSDNSCLFNAVGYVMDKDKLKAKELRQVIAAAVMSDPTTYTEAILGKPNQEYVDWISKPDKWGGAIELAILSDFYGREIAAYDIQTKRCDVYGQAKGYTERVMLIYDGLHYDALGLAPFPDAPEEVDQTIFSLDHFGNIGSPSRLAEKVVEEAHRARNFTDTGNFTLRCGVCQKGVVGQAEAMEHAKATGHFNFQEFR